MSKFKFEPEDFDDIPINDTWDTSIVAGVARDEAFKRLCGIK